MNLKNNSYSLKQLLKWANKKQNSVNIYHSALKKQNKEKHLEIISLHLCTKNVHDMIYSFWDKERDRLKPVILGQFLSVYPPNTPPPPKEYNFEKLKNTVGDIILLHMCTKNHNHMTNGSWDTEWDRIFFPAPLPLRPLLILKTKYLKKWKKMPEDIILLHIRTINDDHMIYGSWNITYDRQNFLVNLHMCAITDNHMIYGSSLNEIWSATDRIFCHFGRLIDIIFIFHFELYFALLSLLTTKKNKIKKNPCRYYHFTHVHHNWQSYVWFRRYGAQQMDGKWHIEVTAPPKTKRTWTFSNTLFNNLNTDTFTDNIGLKNCLRQTVRICVIAGLRKFLYLN